MVDLAAKTWLTEGRGEPMNTYYVATQARYILVEAESEADAFKLGLAMFYELYADIRKQLGNDVPVKIWTLRAATAQEIELSGEGGIVAEGTERTLPILVGSSLVDLEASAKSDWMPMSVPNRESSHGMAWFAHNRATKQNIEFTGFDEAAKFCFHPDNQR